MRRPHLATPMPPSDSCESVLALTKVLKLCIELSGSGTTKLFSGMVGGMIAASEPDSAGSAMYRLAVSIAEEHLRVLEADDVVLFRHFPSAANEELT